MTQQKDQLIVSLQKEITRVREENKRLKNEADKSKDMIYIMEEIIHFAKKANLNKEGSWSDLLSLTIEKAENVLKEVK